MLTMVLQWFVCVHIALHYEPPRGRLLPERDALSAHLALQNLDGAWSHAVEATDGRPGLAGERRERENIGVYECASGWSGEAQITPDGVQRFVRGEINVSARDSATTFPSRLSHCCIIADPCA